MSVIAKSLDVVVWLKLLIGGHRHTFAQLSEELGMSASEVHASVKRGTDAGLINPGSKRPLRQPLEEYLLHGVRYAFPAKRGPISRGIPTSYAAPVLAKHFGAQKELPPVWPDPKGSTRGYALEPLFKPISKAIADSELYALLALVDAIRDGRARERKLAQDELHSRITHANAG
jgi:hypothetical protein